MRHRRFAVKTDLQSSGQQESLPPADSCANTGTGTSELHQSNGLADKERVNTVVSFDCPHKSDGLPDINGLEQSAAAQRASVLETALLQLMTQKVITAYRNCPEVLDDVNASIQSDKNQTDPLDQNSLKPSES